MKRKGKRRLWLRISIGAPILTAALVLLCAWMMLKGTIAEERIELMAATIGGICAFLLSLYTALCVSRKKLVWGMLTALSYGMGLLLGNLLFFGEAYDGLCGVLLPVVGGGAVASLLGALRRRKSA